MAPPRSKNAGTGNKEARKANFLKKIFNGDQATKTSSFLKRKPTLKKKAMELETLCGIEVCIVFFDPNGKVDFWPEDESEVRRRCSFYMGLNKKDKKEWNYSDFMKDKKKKLMKKKEKKRVLDTNSVVLGEASQLSGLKGSKMKLLESKIKGLKGRIDSLRNKKGIVETTKEEEDCFSDLPSIQVLEGTNPNRTPAPTPIDFSYYPADYSFPVMMMMNGNNNDNQIMMMRNDDQYYYENPMVQMQNNFCYNMGLGAADQSSSIINNNCLFNSYSSSSSSSSDDRYNYRRSHSIYDATPISQWPFNFGTCTGLPNSSTQVDPRFVGVQIDEQQGIRGQNDQDFN